MSRFHDLLTMMAKRQASDLLFSPGSPLHMKVAGQLHPISQEPLTGAWMQQLVGELLDEDQQHRFGENPELNLGMGIDGVGRFRINLFRQRGELAMVVRHLSDRIPGFDELNLPGALAELAMRRRGLVLVVGATGAGKSTTLAAMIDHRNRNSRCHILTIEDPIEYQHRYHQSVVNQREVGLDTHSYGEALKNAMREAPDVILIGEIRDRETMQHAIAYAETGHLCLASLHATNSSQALQRVINFFPEAMHHQVYVDLAHNLAAVVSQRLVPGRDGRQLPAVEVLLATPLVRDLVQKGAVDEVREVMERSTEQGMQSFDQSLYQLHLEGLVDAETALEYAESVSNLRVRIRLNGDG